jgi:ribonuclease-3 family protein
LKIEEFIPVNKTPEEINQMSPLIWAYVGDCVYELYIRTYLVDNTNLKPHKLHIESIKYVKAGAQAKFLQDFADYLSDEEKDIVRRGRNANNHHLPKNSNVQEYMYSTAFEALIGYLYLTKNYDRVKEIIEKYILNEK